MGDRELSRVFKTPIYRLVNAAGAVPRVPFGSGMWLAAVALRGLIFLVLRRCSASDFHRRVDVAVVHGATTAARPNRRRIPVGPRRRAPPPGARCPALTLSTHTMGGSGSKRSCEDVPLRSRTPADAPSERVAPLHSLDPVLAQEYADCALDPRSPQAAVRGLGAAAPLGSLQPTQPAALGIRHHVREESRSVGGPGRLRADVHPNDVLGGPLPLSVQVANDGAVCHRPCCC